MGINRKVYLNYGYHYMHLCYICYMTPWTTNSRVYCVGSGTMEILGETSSKPCEHSLTKVNLWKIQKPHCGSNFSS